MPEILPSIESFNCFACGPGNPIGLRLRFSEAGQDRVRTEFEVGEEHTGVTGVVHGGIVATVLDEAMAWCLYRYRYASHVTATMEQRFPGTVRAGVPLVAEGWITDDRGSRLRMAAAIWERDQPDRLVAEGSGLYVRTPDTTLDTLPVDQRDEMREMFDRYRRRDGSAS
jgi:acyl-coenzyme A thioesterase PaaI-like protein